MQLTNFAAQCTAEAAEMLWINKTKKLEILHATLDHPESFQNSDHALKTAQEICTNNAEYIFFGIGMMAGNMILLDSFHGMNEIKDIRAELLKSLNDERNK